MADLTEERDFSVITNVCLFTDLCWRHRVGLHCYTGPFAEYMSGFLADDLGARNCHHSYGDSRGSEYKLSDVSPRNSSITLLRSVRGSLLQQEDQSRINSK